MLQYGPTSSISGSSEGGKNIVFKPLATYVFVIVVTVKFDPLFKLPANLFNGPP